MCFDFIKNLIHHNNLIQRESHLRAYYKQRFRLWTAPREYRPLIRLSILVSNSSFDSQFFFSTIFKFVHNRLMKKSKKIINSELIKNRDFIKEIAESEYWRRKKKIKKRKQQKKNCRIIIFSGDLVLLWIKSLIIMISSCWSRISKSVPCVQICWHMRNSFA